jgi:hypothetical protein
MKVLEALNSITLSLTDHSLCDGYMLIDRVEK